MKTLDRIRKRWFTSPAVERFLISLFPHSSYPYGLGCRVFPKFNLYPQGTNRNFSYGGISFRADVSDFMDWLGYFRIRDRAHDNFLKLLKPDGVVWDIGAFTGYFSLRAAQQVPNGHVFSFEPYILTFNKLLHNLTINPHLTANIKPYNIALGESSINTYMINKDPHNTSAAYVSDKGDTPCKVVSGDEMLNEMGITRLDAIKIDAEGSEWHILKGMGTLLTQHKPIMLIEFNNQHLSKYNKNTYDLIHILSKYSYNIFDAETMEPLSGSNNIKTQNIIAISA